MTTLKGATTLTAEAPSSDLLIALKWGGALIASAWLSIPAAIQALLVLMTIDYATGFLSAWLRKELCSSVGMRGLIRKTLTLLMVLTAHYLVRMLKLPFDFAPAVGVAFCVNEVISITENCNDAGVPIPPALLDVLLRAKKITGRGRAPGEVREELESPDQGKGVGA